MATLLEELLAITSALTENEVEYAVCGGLALTIHGFPRATFDLDLLIRQESLEKTIQIANEKGYIIKGLEMSFKENAVEIRRVSKIQDGELLTLDLILVTPQMETVWLDREKIDLQNQELWIVSQKGLIFMKRLSGRAKDLIDVERMENEES